MAKYGDALLIVCISFVSAVICEGISWLLIYRTTNYKSLRSTIDRTSKKIETMKTPAAINKAKSKKMDRYELSLKESSRDLSLSKFKSGAVVALVLIVVFGLLSSLFEARPLPSSPSLPSPSSRKCRTVDCPAMTPPTAPWSSSTSSAPSPSAPTCRSFSDSPRREALLDRACSPSPSRSSNRDRGTLYLFINRSFSLQKVMANLVYLYNELTADFNTCMRSDLICILEDFRMLGFVISESVHNHRCDGGRNH